MDSRHSPDLARLSKATRWQFVFLFEGALALTAIIMVTSGILPPVDGWRSIWRPPYWPSVVWGVVGCLPMLVLLWWVMKSRAAWLTRLRKFVVTHVRPFFADFAWWELAVLCLWIGFCEELLFRWALQGGIDAWAPEYGPWLGLIVASLVFGLCHAVSIAYAATTFLIGIYLGGLMILTGDVMSPVVAHGLYDLIALVAIQNAANAEVHTNRHSA